MSNCKENKIFFVNTLELVSESPNTNQKRVRVKIPCFKKIYCPYQYDNIKYNKIYKKLQQLAIKYDDEKIYYRVNPYDIARLCYSYKDNKPVTNDERHIFRYKALHLLYEELAKVLIEKHQLFICNDVIAYLFKRTGIALYIDDELKPQAEIYELQKEPLLIRFKANSMLLRLLRNPDQYEIEQAIELIINKYNISKTI